MYTSDTVEMPFILHCHVDHDLRSKYLAPFDSAPSVNTFQLLLRSVDESLINSLCRSYILNHLNVANNTVMYDDYHS